MIGDGHNRAFHINIVEYAVNSEVLCRKYCRGPASVRPPGIMHGHPPDRGLSAIMTDAES
jgi:hypothetical protein